MEVIPSIGQIVIFIISIVFILVAVYYVAFVAGKEKIPESIPEPEVCLKPKFLDGQEIICVHSINSPLKMNRIYVVRKTVISPLHGGQLLFVSDTKNIHDTSFSILRFEECS